MQTRGFPEPRKPQLDTVSDVDDLMPYARKLVNEREGTSTRMATTGYAGLVGEGDRVLIAVRNLHNETIVEAIAKAFRENGTRVDVITVDIGPDGERTEGMDVDLAITDPTGGISSSDVYIGPDEDVYSNFLGKFWWVEELAVERGYDLLIQSIAGPFSYRYPRAHTHGEPLYMERIPWQTTETFISDGAFFPRELLLEIADRTREFLWEHGHGSVVRLTDPEGTDLTYTLWEEYFENSAVGTNYSEEEWKEHYGRFDLPLRRMSTGAQGNHVIAHPLPPLIEKHDANGTLVSTLGHHSRPYPKLTMEVEGGVVTSVEGGGEKGEKLRDILGRTRDIQYPDYPRPGLLWMWEIAIGTNPKIVRPDNVLHKSEPGNLAERLRSGYIHIGTGTCAGTVSERWATEANHPYGHTDQHLNFPTFEIVKSGGETETLIKKGRLKILDDPVVRDIASKYGDPDDLLTEDWIPPIPGVNTADDYDEFSSDPARYIEEYEYER